MTPPSRRLFLLRHAEAAQSTGSGGDAARALTLMGEERARRVALHLSRDPIDHILASPAKRVQQTLAPILASRPSDSVPTLQVEALIYNTCGAGLLDLLRGLGSDVAVCLLIGHNPSLEELARELLPAGAAGFHGFQPGTLLDLSFAAEWVELEAPLTVFRGVH